MAFAPYNVSYADDLGTEVVDIYVGPQRKRYVVHKALLTSQSDYYLKALTGNFIEAQENSIHLKEEDPAAVALFVGWLYRGCLPGTDKAMASFVKNVFSLPQDLQVPISELGTVYLFTPPQIPAAVPLFGAGGQGSSSDSFQSICSQYPYEIFSPEELRIADYKLGRKFEGDGMLAPVPPLPQAQAPLPTVPTGSFSASDFGLGAQPPMTSNPGQNAAPHQTSSSFTHLYPSIYSSGSSTTPHRTRSAGTSSGLFGGLGSVPPASSTTPHPTGSSGASISLFGNPSSVPPASSASPATPNESTQIPSTAGSFDAVPSSTVTPNQTSTVAQPGGLFVTAGQPTAGLFGRPPPSASTQATTNAPNSGLFGSTQSTSLFGTASRHTTGLFGGGGLFGSLRRTSTTPATISCQLPPGAKMTTISPQKPSIPSEFGYYPSIKHTQSPRIFLKGIPQTDPTEVQFIDLEKHQEALLNLCIMAETQCWTALFNDAMSAFVRGEHRLQRPLSIDFIDRIYIRTYPDSTLRVYVLDSLARMKMEGVEDITQYMQIATKHEDFLADLLGKLMGQSEPLKAITDRDVKDYYMFGMSRETLG